MTHGLNLTIPIGQDEATQKKLAALAEQFEDKIQPAIDRALRESKLVHFARILVIDNKYIQVITAYDGDHLEYTEFFRRALTPIFKEIFSLSADAPDVNDPNGFFNYSKSKNIRALGRAADGALDMDGNTAGWLFSAYDHREVATVLPKLDP